jgi:crotonobetaine/carnitine-CoA ligase
MCDERHYIAIAGQGDIYGVTMSNIVSSATADAGGRPWSEHWGQQAKEAMQVGRDVPWLLKSQAERYGDKTWLIWEPFSGVSRSWTYQQFRHDVVALAGSLSARGINFGHRVLIHLDNSPEFMISWFACAEIGAVAVSTNTRSVARDMEYFAQHAEVVAAITSPGFAALVAESAPQISLLIVTNNEAGDLREIPDGITYEPFEGLLINAPAPAPRPAETLADLGIQFTSGTTSRPKAVLWTHANVMWGAEVSAAHMRLRDSDTTLVILPLFHTNAQTYSMMPTLWTGGTMVLQPRFSASRFWEVSLRHRVTWCSMIGFCVKALMAGELPSRHDYRFWATAARLPEVEEVLGLKTFGWWGMTETVTQGIVASYEFPGPRMSIGRAAPEYEISIRHPDGQPVAPGESGELFIRGTRGVTMFKEYFGNPEATAAAFDEDGWFSTGDSIITDTEGNLFFGDRLKDMLKVGAENVAASEIETVILATGLVSECAVIGKPHPMLDEVPVAFVIATPGAPEDIADRIIQACAADLADFKVPREVFVVEELPRSTLEKIAKNELRKRFASTA